MIMKEQVNFDGQEVTQRLGGRIASLEIQLASEQAAKQAIIRYAEELEQKLESHNNEVN
jgi:tetrahydromethanopterin S-methyltransferase subunit G